MVLIRQRFVRETSPTDYNEPDSLYEAHRTRLISNAALDDSDAMSAASRKHDQQILKEINDRLINTTISKPSPVLKRRASISSRPPQISKPPLPTSSAIVMTSFKPSDADTDVNYEVDLMMPATSRALRSGSVPPSAASSSNAAAILAEFNNQDIPMVKTRIVQNGTSVLPLNGTARYGSYVVPGPVHTTKYIVENAPDSYQYYSHAGRSSTPSADFAVRQAHRDLDRIEQELRTDATFTPRASPVRSVRTHTTETSRPILMRSSSFHGPFSGVRVRSPSPSYRSTVTSSVPLHQYSYSTLTDPLVHTTTRTYHYPTTSDVSTLNKILLAEAAYAPVASKVYLPSTLIRCNSVVTPSTVLSSDVEALIRSARTLPEVSATRSYVRPSPLPTVYPSPSTSFTPSSSTGLPPIPKAQMSTARKHAREVLCKVKKDPHYFD